MFIHFYQTRGGISDRHSPKLLNSGQDSRSQACKWRSTCLASNSSSPHLCCTQPEYNHFTLIPFRSFAEELFLYLSVREGINQCVPAVASRFLYSATQRQIVRDSTNHFIPSSISVALRVHPKMIHKNLEEFHLFYTRARLVSLEDWKPYLLLDVVSFQMFKIFWNHFKRRILLWDYTRILL
jgi:hypothetical protein